MKPHSILLKESDHRSLAFDFINGESGEPLLTEISYCYDSESVYNCPGHWDRELNWHEGHMFPEDAIITDLLNDIKSCR